MLARTIRLIGLAGVLGGGVVVETAAAQQNANKTGEGSPAPVRKGRFEGDVSSYYRNYKLEKPEIKELKELDRKPAPGPNIRAFGTMARKTVETNLGGAASPSALRDTFTIVDSQDGTEIRDRCAEVIRPDIRKLGLELGPSTQVNLGSLRLAEPDASPSSTTITGTNISDRSPVRTEIPSPHDQWKVTFSLEYQGFRLSSASRIVILVSGNRLAIDRRNVPTVDRLPAASEIETYRLRQRAQNRASQLERQPAPKPEWDAAVAVARSDFRKQGEALAAKNPGKGPPASGDELDGVLVEEKTPGLEIWLPQIGRGRLAYKFALAPKAPTSPNPGTEYWVEAVPESSDKPRILHRGSGVFPFQAPLPPVHGLARGSYWSRSSLHPDRLTKNAPLRGLFVDIHCMDQGGNRVVKQSPTDELGRFTSFAPAGFNLKASLAGPQCMVWVWNLGRYTASIPGRVFLPAKAGDPAMIDFNPLTDVEIAQVSAFRWINEAYDYYNQLLKDPSSQIKQVRVIVNDDVNPFVYMPGPKQVHLERNVRVLHPIFQPANGACADMILHEYAHAIDWMTSDRPVSPSSTSFDGFDFRLKSAVKGVGDLPREGNSVIWVAALPHGLHVRIFDSEGNTLVDADERELENADKAKEMELENADKAKKEEIRKNFKEQLARWWPPHELTKSEKDTLIEAVKSIIDAHAAYLSACYFEGFADAFVILYKSMIAPPPAGRKEMVVGEDLLGDGKHARDYRSSQYTIMIDRQPRPAKLKWGDMQFESYFRDNHGDGREHFGGRVFALFVADLVDRFENVPGYDRRKALRQVALLVFLAGTLNPRNIPDAVHKMQNLLERDVALPDDTRNSLLQHLREAASDRGIPH
jgi:hypothetical protein